ncbi:hypothetical protein [Sphingobacterium chungjuense]|uniref:hypothetical protein n=1 Tax=Sphingobacterium chungjuense TaxID=2675553 RepID=UPI00140E6127|nr:hypothetical protein [Sphingobacterium chungjuense]
MTWKQNLSEVIINSGFQLIEISAWTNLDMPKISAMKNMKHPSLHCKEFLILKLLLRKEHSQLIKEIFGADYFEDIRKIVYKPELTCLGKIIKERHQFEILPKKELVKATNLASSRIDYLIEKDDQNIKIEEITRLEIALGEEVGAICNLQFPKIKLNNKKDYQLRLKMLKEYNKRANERRKK